MFGDIPDNYKHQTADNEEEGFLYVHRREVQRQGPAPAAGLLTRDHVARCIVREVKAGPRQSARRRLPGTRHLRQWIKSASRRSTRAEHWKKKLPSMYHQFKELGNIDITKHADGSRPRRRTTSWAASTSTPTRRCRRSPACSPAANVRAGINGANRLGGNSLSDLLVLGKRAGEYAAKYAKDRPAPARCPTTRSRRPRAGRCAFIDEPEGRREPVQGAAGLAGNDAGPGRHRSPGRRDDEGPGRA